MQYDLNRFLKAQENDYEIALAEIKSGCKRSHWMWYIFPQYKGLGYSETSKYYAIQSLDEAKEFLNHPILGFRLQQITLELLKINNLSATEIFGRPDDSKLKSCMTLFASIDTSQEKLFQIVLDQFFNGQKDRKKLEFIAV